MKIQSFGRVSIVAAVLCAGSAVSIGATCPCESPPMGTVMTKGTAPLPGGGTFKLECTNESQYGNFETYYCTPGGEKHHIGTCIYVGGKNWFRYTKDPVTGEVCTVVHYNMDDGTPDNPTHQLKVYVYDAKTGMTTTTCYKLNPDGTYTPVGTPTCHPATDYQPIEDAESLPKFLNTLFLTAEVAPQTWAGPTLNVVSAVTGSRELVVDTDGVDVTFLAGDVIDIDVPAEYITLLDPRFELLEVDGAARLVMLDDATINDVFPIARISSAMGRVPVAFATTSSDDASFQAQIDAVICTATPLNINPNMAIMFNADVMIDEAAIVADLSGDSTVDGQDLALLLSNYGGANTAGDVDGDGVVDSRDLVELLAAWGATDE